MRSVQRSERWGDRRKSRQEGNSTEEHVGYLATSGATEAEDERVQLEKRRKFRTEARMENQGITKPRES